MRRSICYCEPNVAYAGEINTWKFIYTPSVDLPKGTKFNFDLQSKCRNIDWDIPTTNLKAASNVVFAELENKKILQMKQIENPGNIAPSFEFVLPVKLEAGSPLTIVVGATKNPRQNGTRAQTNAQRRRTFNLYVDPSGKGKYEEPESFNMDVKGNQLAAIRVLAPSFVAKNKRFDLVVRFEDQYGNLTNLAPADTLVELSHEHLRENLSWKLFVPETGFISLPNLYFNEPGVYTIRLLNTKTKQIFNSPPIKCFAENTRHLYWGLLHGESDRIDSTENIESCLRHFRDDKAANFYGASPFENQEETSNETWKLIVQNLADFDEPDRFTTFVGFQWSGVRGEEGVRQLLFAKEHKQLLRKKDPKYSALKKIYKSYSPKELISIPTFTMGKGYEYNFKEFDSDYERVVEIYNAWGSSECTQKEGNAFPIKSLDKQGVQESAEGSILKALRNNCRFGFVAGGLDDRGIYADFFESEQVQYSPGLTAIISAEHSRASLIEALYNRSCYATTGEKIILGIYLAGLPMGSETSSAVKHGLNINRHISGYVAGTAKIKKVQLVRNGSVIKTFEADSYWLDFTYDDMVPLEKVVINANDKKPPFVFYYLRFTQEDGHMAWSSPIWIDYIAGAAINRPARRSQAKQVKPSLLEVDEDEEEEEEEEGFDDEDEDEDEF